MGSNSFISDKNYKFHQKNNAIDQNNDIRNIYIDNINDVMKPFTKKYINIIPLYENENNSIFLTKNCCKTNATVCDKNCILKNYFIDYYNIDLEDSPFILLIKLENVNDEFDFKIKDIEGVFNYYKIPRFNGEEIFIDKGFSVLEISELLSKLKVYIGVENINLEDILCSEKRINKIAISLFNELKKRENDKLIEGLISILLDFKKSEIGV